MRGLIEAIARERDVNRTKARLVKWAFVLLSLGLAMIALEAGKLAFEAR